MSNPGSPIFLVALGDGWLEPHHDETPHSAFIFDTEEDARAFARDNLEDADFRILEYRPAQQTVIHCCAICHEPLSDCRCEQDSDE